MPKTRVIPILLIAGGKLIKTRQFGEPKYLGDPLNAVRILNEKEVQEIVILDVEASTNGVGIPYSLIEQLCDQCFMPFCYGGGIKSLDEAKKVIRLGAEKISLQSAALENPGIVSEISNAIGSSSVVVSVDTCRKDNGTYEVVGSRAENRTGIDAISFVKQVESLGAGEIIITSVEQEGMQNGYDLDLVKLVSDAVSIPVIAHGGAGRVEDLALAAAAGAAAVGAGSLFSLFGKHRAPLITYPTTQELVAAGVP